MRSKINKCLFHFYNFFIIFSTICSYAENTPSVAVTAGQSTYRTLDKKIFLETANNRRPTMSQGYVIFIADKMIYDEKEEIGYAYGNLRFADINNKTFLSAQEGTYFTKEKKIVLRKTPEILLEQKENSSAKITGEVITIYPDDSYIHVQGNIELYDGKTLITGKEARIWSKKNRMIISGKVQSISEDQKLASDRLNIQFKEGNLEYYIALDNVIAINTKDKFTICSEVLLYNNEKKTFKATSEPYLYFQEKNTVSYAHVIEYNSNSGKGSLLGDVISVQEEKKQTAYSRWALYDQKEKKITMYGNPRLKQEESEIFGREIIVNIDDNTMEILGGGRGFFHRK